MAVLGIKPVRQRVGCARTLGKTCALIHYSTLKWKARRCEGSNKAMYIQHYERMLSLQSASARKALPPASERKAPRAASRTKDPALGRA